MSEYHFTWLAADSASDLSDAGAKSDKSTEDDAFGTFDTSFVKPARLDETCSNPGCYRPLRLPETQAIGRCFGCLTDEEMIDVLASMKRRREVTKAKVRERSRQLDNGEEY